MTMEKLTGLCLLLAGLSLAVTEDTYFTEGGTLTLDVSPPYPNPIKNILWKLNGNLLADWNEVTVVVEFYRSYKGRTALDTKNGQLIVRNMTQDDKGVYSVEINSNIQSVSYTVKSITIAPQPVVVIRTLTCTVSSKMCTVSCDGNTTGAEPVTYSWKMGDGKWEEGAGKNIEITNSKNVHDESITCRMTNPLSEKVSETIDNPLYQEDVPGNNVGIVIGVLVAILAVVAGVGVGVTMWKRKIGPCQSQGSHKTDTGDKTTDQPENHSLTANDNKPAPVKPANQDEGLPLNGDQTA